MLQRGSTGAEVARVQKLLNDTGWRSRGEGLTLDGDFGPETERAVRWFQAAHGLEVDGVVGDITLPHLEAATAVKPPEVEKSPKTEVPTTWGDKILRVALEYHAAKVVERPDGSNTGGPAPGMIQRYSVDAIQQPFSLHGEPWCAMFVWQCVTRAGYRLSTNGFAAVYSWAAWARKSGLAHDAATFEPRPGDIFCIGECSTFRTGHHIGIVEEYLKPSRKIVTVEGNCKNRVSSIERNKAGGVGGEDSGGGISIYIRIE